jgi:phage FluMu protein gp41
MRLAELEEMMTEDPTSAEAAIDQMVATSNVSELVSIARTSRAPVLRLRAIEALGRAGGPTATTALREMLEAARAPLKIGGTEQRREYEARRSALTLALSRAGGTPTRRTT